MNSLKMTKVRANLPWVTAEVTFLPTEAGGRAQPPVLGSKNRPHIVIGSPDVRRPQVDDHDDCREPYLGVRFLGDDQPLTTVR